MWLIPSDIALLEIKAKIFNMLIYLQATIDPVPLKSMTVYVKCFSKQKLVKNGIILNFCNSFCLA